MASSSDLRVCVVGAGGLLGSAVTRESRSQGFDVITAKVRWPDPELASSDLEATFNELLAVDAQQYAVMWCAGAGVTSTAADDLSVELATFQTALTRLGRAAVGRLDRVTVFLASSAGAVYSGAMSPPFDECTAPKPLAPYGRAKLAMEEALTSFTHASQCKSWIGRISNLYGPGQNLSKTQGIISALLRASLTRRPTSIFVSLDTLRDYLFVDDAAHLVVSGTQHLAIEGTKALGTTTLKILAHGSAVSLGEVIACCSKVVHRRLLIVNGASDQSRVQAKDLRFRSNVWCELDDFPKTLLPVGVHRTLFSLSALTMSPQRP